MKLHQLAGWTIRAEFRKAPRFWHSQRLSSCLSLSAVKVQIDFECLCRWLMPRFDQLKWQYEENLESSLTSVSLVADEFFSQDLWLQLEVAQQLSAAPTKCCYYYCSELSTCCTVMWWHFLVVALWQRSPELSFVWSEQSIELLYLKMWLLSERDYYPKLGARGAWRKLYF